MIASKRAVLNRLALAALFVLGLTLLFRQLKSPANLYDEGLTLLNAERILQGQVPYRDFWTLYAPGYFYLLAGLFKLTGPNILAARILDTLLRFLLTLAVYALARRLTTRWVALIPWAFVTLWLSAIRFYSYPAFPATAAIVLTALALLRYLEATAPASDPAASVPARRGVGWLAATGLALGLTATIRLDFGGYAAIGAAAAVAIAELQTAAGRGQPWRLRLASVLRAEAILAGAAALVALPLYGCLAAASGLPTVWDDLIAFPATTFRAVRHLPVPTLLPDLGRMTGEQWEDWVRLYLPLGIYAAALGASAWRLVSGTVAHAGRGASLSWLHHAGQGAQPPCGTADENVRRNDFSRSARATATKVATTNLPIFRTATLLAALSLTGLGLVIKATSRYHELHALPAAIIALIVAVALAYRIPHRLWRTLPFSVGVAGLAFLLLYGPYILHFTDMFKQTSRYVTTGCYARLERAGCVPLGQDQERAAEYVRAQTGPDERIFVGNTRHDLIFVNDLLFYFLADRPSATRYAELHPGLATTLPIQQAIVQELASQDVQWVVTLRMWESREPNASSVSSGVTHLDDFIRDNYATVTTFGGYRVLRRR
ncbi:MAG: glycosyltransferase family 39 protein [Chloroflexi bacterium]|nr:glycosyltransferase family 39 protein [Chloroflexota bacterium]